MKDLDLDRAALRATVESGDLARLRAMTEAAARRAERKRIGAESRWHFARPFAATAGGPGGSGTPTVGAFLLEMRVKGGRRHDDRGRLRNAARLYRRHALRQRAAAA